MRNSKIRIFILFLPTWCLFLSLVFPTMTNPYENGETMSAREMKSTEEPQSSTKFKKTNIEGNDNDERYRDEMFRTFKTQKKKFLEDKVMVKNTKNKKLGIWATTFLPLIQKDKKNDRRIQRAIFEGIPAELRDVVWWKLLGNIHQDYSKLFEQLLDMREYMKEKDTYKKSESLIEKDLHRTYAKLDIFKPGNLLHTPLRNILTAFIVHRPDIGYIQGMSYLAAVFLMNLEENQAFSLFLSLTNWDILYYCFWFNMDKVNWFFSVFQTLIKKYTPYVFDILQEHNIAVSLFLFEWIITMFSNTFPTTVWFRIWDQIFFYGQGEIIVIALSILKCIEDELVECGSYEKWVEMLKYPNKFITEEELFDWYDSMKIDRDHLLNDILGG